MNSKTEKQRICPTHKLQSTQICLNLKCQLNRILCQKCIQNHQSHASDLIELKQSQEFENLDLDLNGQVKQQVLQAIFNQASSLGKIFQQVEQLENIRKKFNKSLDNLKKQYFLSLKIDEQIFEPTSILNIINQNSYSQEGLTNYFSDIQKTNQIQQYNIQAFQDQIDSVGKSINSIDQSILGLVNSISIFQTQSALKDEQTRFNQETKSHAQNVQQQQKISQNNIKNQHENNQQIKNHQSIDQKEDLFEKQIQQNQVFSQLLNPLLSQKIDFQSLSKKVVKSLVYRIEFDGCSKGNPGLAGVGFLIKQHENNSQVLESFAVNVGTKTNNQSEYLALIYGLYVSLKIGIQKLFIQGDSQLIIYQMTGKYNCSNDNIKKYYELCKMLQSKFQQTSFNHVYREQNKEADHLSNVAISKQNKN
ncbi:RNase H family protein (macronuclear) [Tetrahymena thermophila SB210]|uniref:RNase H family protein n=1 Tax=Tetrahymena thermophila (strain SB210) TaxID=312017 RepID=Q22C81_TETTS|nr:RNase H family protein [Tetrahymena thermophila SB210]EAR82875.2 RNase H family protein [Tetrahymena thermophila SB210]|eukprot:XP_001030538.2 RNase H family protein [Tetrahymena thermophila SB210]